MSFPSVPLLLPLNGKVTVNIHSYSQGSRVKGAYVKGSPTVRQIEANIQPVLKGTETLLVPEGDRSKEIIKLYTTSPVYSRVEGINSVEPDVVEFDGKFYEIMKVIHYQMGVLDHFKAIAVRKEVT